MLCWSCHVDNVVCMSENCVGIRCSCPNHILLVTLFGICCSCPPIYHSTWVGDTDNFVENMKSLMDYHESQIRISVEGFDTSADPVEIYTSLQNLFKTCGKVNSIEFKIDHVKKQLIRYVYFLNVFFFTFSFWDIFETNTSN